MLTSVCGPRAPIVLTIAWGAHRVLLSFAVALAVTIGYGVYGDEILPTAGKR